LGCLPTRRMHPCSRRRCSRRPRMTRSTLNEGHSWKHAHRAQSRPKRCVSRRG
jgi:hypothetical protein